MHRRGGQAVEILELAPDPDAASRARRFVATVLEGWQVVGLGPDASLVTSELVSNAVIHARTPIELRVAHSADGVRIEVRDAVADGIVLFRPVSVLEPGGLGLRVVAQLATRWGVDPVPDGKSVWAELCTTRLAAAPAAPEMAAGSASVPSTGDWPWVRLVEVPTDPLIAWEAHLRDLRREFALLAPHRRPLEEVGPEDPLELVVATLDRYWDVVRPIWVQARPVGGRRPRHVSVVVQLPERVVTDGPRFLQALDAADEMSRRGVLLTEAASDDVVAFRRWFVDTLVRQVAGSDRAGPGGQAGSSTS